MNWNLAELEQRGLISSKARYVGENLVNILRHGSGGKRPTRAWLYQKKDGAWAHTFDQAIAIGGLGGEEIPISCLDGKKLFEPKKELVAAFLVSFQLAKPEIEAVINANL